MRAVVMRRLAALVLCGLLAVPRLALAQDTRPRLLAHMDGQVSYVSGPASDPSGFTLVTNRKTVDLQVAPTATFVAVSAEAEVEGFVAGDYADVVAQWQQGVWTARRIAFDVQPLADNHPVTFSATVVRTGENGRSVLVRLQSGDLRKVLIVVQTRFLVAGQTVESPPVLTRDEPLRITARVSPRGWVANQIDVKQATPLA